MSCASVSTLLRRTNPNSNLLTLYVSLELSTSKWLVTSLVSGTNKMSRHFVSGGDGGALLRLLAELKAKAAQQAGTAVTISAIQEAGMHGFSRA